LINYLSAKNAKNEDDFVDNIIDIIDNHIKFNAEDLLLGNKIINTNVAGLKTA